MFKTHWSLPEDETTAPPAGAWEGGQTGSQSVWPFVKNLKIFINLQSAALGSDERFGQSLSRRPHSENTLPEGGATIRPFVHIISQETLMLHYDITQTPAEWAVMSRSDHDLIIDEDVWMLGSEDTHRHVGPTWLTSQLHLHRVRGRSVRARVQNNSTCNHWDPVQFSINLRELPGSEYASVRFCHGPPLWTDCCGRGFSRPFVTSLPGRNTGTPVYRQTHRLPE